MAVVRREGMQRCRAAAEPLPSRVTLSRAVQDVCRGCLLQTHMQDADVPAEMKGVVQYAGGLC